MRRRRRFRPNKSGWQTPPAPSLQRSLSRLPAMALAHRRVPAMSQDFVGGDSSLTLTRDELPPIPAVLAAEHTVLSVEIANLVRISRID
jgi:hypothetical protein